MKVEIHLNREFTMRVIKRLLSGAATETFNVRLPAVPITARTDGDGRMAVWFLEDEDVAIPLVRRKVCLQSTNAPFPNEAMQFLAHVGMFLRPTMLEKHEDDCDDIECKGCVNPKQPASELNVFVDMSSNVQITNDGTLILPH